jgi:multidrug efflux pump subunit AcrB
MKNIMNFFITNWRFSFILTFFIFLSGLVGLWTLQRESFPPVDFAKVQILTIYPGSTSQDVEDKVTIPIEKELQSLEGIKDIKSTSQNEQSKIEIRIDTDNSSLATKDVIADIQRALDRVQNLPSDILEHPRLTEVKAKEIPIIELAITGKNDSGQRHEIALKLKSLLDDISGISSVRLIGYQKKEYQVLLDLFKIQKNEISIPEIRSALSARVQDTPAGYIKDSKKNQMVRIKSKINQAQDLKEIPVRTGDNGQSIYLKNLGEVIETIEDPKILTSLNGQEATLLTVIKKSQADAIKTVEVIKENLKKFSATLDPEFQVHIYNDESQRIARRINIVSSNAIQGFFLVLLITFLFLPAKLSAMIALSLPLSLFGTLYFMQLMGAQFNLVTMLGLIISLGMLVDNSVVIGELYAQSRQDGLAPTKAALLSAHRFWVALFCSILTTLAAFTPMLLTKGVMGQFIRWIPIVVNIALIFSLIDSFFLLPARLQFILKDSSHQKETSFSKSWFLWVEKKFRYSVSFFIARPYKTTLGFFLLFILSFLLTITGNRFELFPKEGVEFYIGRIEMPIQTPVQVTHSEVQRLSQEIFTLLGGRSQVEAVVGRAGIQQAGVGDPLEKTDEHFGMITLKIPVEIAATQKTDTVLAKLKELPLGRVQSLHFEALANGPPVGKPLNLILRSDNESDLKQVREKMMASLAQIPGIQNLATDEIRSGSEILVLPKSSALNYVKLNEQDLGLYLRTAYQGLIIGTFYDPYQDFVLRLRFNNSFRQDFSYLEKLKILNQRHLLIDLKPLVELKEQEGPPVLKRYGFKRSVTLTAETKTDTLTSVALNKKASELLKDLQKSYPQVTQVFGGEAESTKESVQSLFIALGLAVVGILGILVFAFNSFLKPFLILSSIPLGLIGINVAFFLHQRPLSFLALIGTIGLAGVIVNSAIILVSAITDYFKEHPLEKEDSSAYLKALTQVTTERLRPVLITSLTTVAGLFPTAYALGGYDATLVPLTLAMGWGLFAGTFLSLVWIPVGYRLIEKR